MKPQPQLEPAILRITNLLRPASDQHPQLQREATAGLAITITTKGRTYAVFPSQGFIEDYADDPNKLDFVLDNLRGQLLKSPTRCLELLADGSLVPIKTHMIFGPAD